MNPLKEKYLNEVVPAMQKSLNLENPMQYPKIEKVVVNIGLGEALDNPKALDAAVNDLTQITGQKPIITKARVSIANYRYYGKSHPRTTFSTSSYQLEGSHNTWRS